MKKVFQWIYCLNLGGTETVLMNWYRHIDREKIQFDFGVPFVYQTPYVEEINRYGGRIFVLSPTDSLSAKLKFMYRLYRTLKEQGPYEALQTHEHFFAGVTCMVAKWAGVKKRFTISHYALGAKPLTRKQKILLPVHRCLIWLFSTDRLAVSQEAGKSLYGQRMSFKLIHNGIDLKKFVYDPQKRAQKRAELQLENKFVVGHIGRFAEQKNYTFLIDIFAEIYKQNPQARLVLVGQGELEQKIRQKAERLGLARAVSFMGEQQQVADFYQVFDVFLLPSLFEGLPLVAVEAQATGLPCVMSDVIAKETFMCNSTAVPLKVPARQWADTVLRVTKDFVRKSQTEVLRQAGYDVADVGKFIEKEYLQNR